MTVSHFSVFESICDSYKALNMTDLICPAPHDAQPIYVYNVLDSNYNWDEHTVQSFFV